MPDVGFCGAKADVQVAGDLAVGQAVGDENEDFTLAVGKGAELRGAYGRGGRPGGEPFDQPLGDSGVEQRVALRDGADGLDELTGRGVFQQESAGTTAQRGIDLFVEVEGGQDQDLGVLGSGDAPGGLKPVDSGHADVHEDHVRLFGPDQGDRLLARGRLADDEEVGGGLEDAAQPGAHEFLVVGHGYP